MIFRRSHGLTLNLDEDRDLIDSAAASEDVIRL